MRLHADVFSLLQRLVENRPVVSRAPRARCGNAQPTRLRRALHPALGTLEPRFVLNATAELSGLAQLAFSNDFGVDQTSVAVDVEIQTTIGTASLVVQGDPPSAGRLTGAGVIPGDVIVRNGGVVAPGPGTRILTVGGLDLDATSTIELELRGNVAGINQDQIVIDGSVASGRVNLGGARLDIAFNDPNQLATPNTQYVLVRNDAADAIEGNFSVDFAIDGTLGGGRRALAEGDLVAQDFFGSGRRAYITYAGGDGNDVAIVTAGDVTIAGDDVTLINRVGTNIEIRTGDDFTSAQAATPTVRPIAAVNDFQIRVIGSPQDQAVFIDFDGLVDPTPGAIQYTGEIFFVGGGLVDNDSLVLFDSDLTSDDNPQAIRYVLDGPMSGAVQVTTIGGATQFAIRVEQLENISQPLVIADVDVQFSDFDDQVIIDQDPLVAMQTRLTATPVVGRGMSVSIVNPTSRFSILGGGGNDDIRVLALGNANTIPTGLVVDGQDGDDRIDFASNLTLGRGALTGNLVLAAELTDIHSTIDTRGGDTSGNVTITGGTRVRLLSGASIQVGDGRIIIDAARGEFDSTGGSLVSTQSTDAITIQNASLVRLGDVDAEAGQLQIEAETLTANISQATDSRLIVDRLVVDTIGAVDFSNPGNDFRLLESVTANQQIAITDVNDVRLGTVRSASESLRAIVIDVSGGSVIDGGDDQIDLIAARGGVSITSQTGIGDGNAIETQVARLQVTASDVGAIKINEFDAIELLNIETTDGLINVFAAGTITATRVVSMNRSNVDDDPVGVGPHRDIRLFAVGVSSDVFLTDVQALGGADVLIFASDDVFDTLLSDSLRIIGDDLVIETGNESDDDNFSIFVSTDVNDLVFAVTGQGPGDVQINELNSIRLAASDLASDDDRLFTANGKITIVAGDSIFISDDDASNDGDSLDGDREIVAAGDRGQVLLQAMNTIELAGATQIVTSQSSAGSITINGETIVLGEQIEFNTGLGISRWFSPRPMVGLADTAFFDFTTVATNILTQSGANNATGNLSLRIGRPGELGFTIDIDWGAATNRFQTTDRTDLIGDVLYDWDHEYTESDILNSRLNGRTSATDPLQVRFAITHHPSIVVTGASVTQQVGLVEPVAGRLISSTDDVTTALFDNGTAAFIIPNLTIPVAFFPVRQIIPETQRPEVFVRSETVAFFASGTVETVEASSSSSVSREEFLQIRILSPEPGGEDIAEPQRLPDDILSGDKLKQLFKELPDGQYEIQYVLGDGNERTLLKTDVRGGESVVPGDESDGSKLELKPIDLEEAKQDLQESLQPTGSPRAETSQPNPFSLAGRFARQHLKRNSLDGR